MKFGEKCVRTAAAVLAAAVLLLMTGCARKTEESGPEEIRVPYTAEQMLIVTSSARAETEDLYTPGIWKIRLGGTQRTYDEVFNEELKEFFIDMTAAGGMAGERGIRLEPEEKTKLADAASAFYAASLKGDSRFGSLTEEETGIMFRDYAAALKLQDSMRNDERAEVSESEARVMRLQKIEVDDAGTAEVIRQKAEEGEDFYVLAKMYAGNRSTTVRAVQGDFPADAERQLLDLNDGGISPVIGLNGKYCVFRCIDSYDEEESARRREQLQTERLQELCREAYGNYEKKHRIIMDEALWQKTVSAGQEHYDGGNFFRAVREAMQDEGV